MNLHDRRVIIVEDNPELRELYAFMVNGIENYAVIGVYETAESAINKLIHDKPDLVIMDLELPGMGGVEGIGQIKRKFPRIEILVISILEDDDSIFQALSAGASGYISKSSGILEIEKALNQLESGGAYMTSRIARRVIESFQKNHFSPLTKRETEVLSLIAKGKTYTMIAADLNISSDTVKSHIKNIYSKLHVDTKADAISVALREKLI